jgi:hypothetical protein
LLSGEIGTEGCHLIFGGLHEPDRMLSFDNGTDKGLKQGRLTRRDIFRG